MANHCPGRPRQAYPPRWRDLLQPRSHVNAIAEHALAVIDDLSQVDADAHAHASFFRQLGIGSSPLLLHRHGGSCCGADGGKDSQQAVAGSIDQAPLIVADNAADCGQVLLQCAVYRCFVLVNQAAELDDIRMQHGQQGSLWMVARARHGCRGYHQTGEKPTIYQQRSRPSADFAGRQTS